MMRVVLSIAAGCICLMYFAGMLFRYFLNNLGVVSFASVITNRTYFALHMHCISIIKSHYIFWDDDSALICVTVLYLYFVVSFY
jgi:hypothetical protein